MILFDSSIYSPGFASKGKDGYKGFTGKCGAGIFYVPCDLRTYNNVLFALQRIKNNQTFSDDVIQLPNEWEYKTTDVFVDSNGIRYHLNSDKTGFDCIYNESVMKNTITNVRIESGKLLFDADIELYEYDLIESVYNSGDLSESALPGDKANYQYVKDCINPETLYTLISNDLKNISILIKSKISGNTLLFNLEKIS